MAIESRTVARATVSIHRAGGSSAFLGTGVLVATDKILTAKHVVKQFKAHQIVLFSVYDYQKGNPLEVAEIKLFATGFDRDIAMLRFQEQHAGSRHPIEIRTDNVMRQANCPSLLVSMFSPVVDKQTKKLNLLQSPVLDQQFLPSNSQFDGGQGAELISSDFVPGNSGAPVTVNDQVIGLVTARRPEANRKGYFVSLNCEHIIQWLTDNDGPSHESATSQVPRSEPPIFSDFVKGGELLERTRSGFQADLQHNPELQELFEHSKTDPNDLFPSRFVPHTSLATLIRLSGNVTKLNAPYDDDFRRLWFAKSSVWLWEILKLLVDDRGIGAENTLLWDILNGSRVGAMRTLVGAKVFVGRVTDGTFCLHTLAPVDHGPSPSINASKCLDGDTMYKPTSGGDRKRAVLRRVYNRTSRGTDSEGLTEENLISGIKLHIAVALESGRPYYITIPTESDDAANRARRDELIQIIDELSGLWVLKLGVGGESVFKLNDEDVIQSYVMEFLEMGAKWLKK